MPKDIPPILKNEPHYHVLTANADQSMASHAIYIAYPETLTPGSTVNECRDQACYSMHFAALTLELIARGIAHFLQPAQAQPMAGGLSLPPELLHRG